MDLAEKVGIDSSKITLWRSGSQAYCPSVIVQKGRINLVCPLGFIQLFQSDNGAATAMLAHEFGHVLQQDTRLWLRTEALARAIKTIIYINVAILLLRLAYYLLDGNFTAFFFGTIISIGIYDFYKFTIKYVLSARKRSEQSADLFAIATVSPDCLIRAVDRYTARSGLINSI